MLYSDRRLDFIPCLEQRKTEYCEKSRNRSDCWCGSQYTVVWDIITKRCALLFISGYRYFSVVTVEKNDHFIFEESSFRFVQDVQANWLA